MACTVFRARSCKKLGFCGRWELLKGEDGLGRFGILHYEGTE